MLWGRRSFISIMVDFGRLLSNASAHLDASVQEVRDAYVGCHSGHGAVHEQLALVTYASRDLGGDIAADGVDRRPRSPAACRRRRSFVTLQNKVLEVCAAGCMRMPGMVA